MQCSYSFLSQKDAEWLFSQYLDSNPTCGAVVLFQTLQYIYRAKSRCSNENPIRKFWSRFAADCTGVSDLRFARQNILNANQLSVHISTEFHPNSILAVYLSSQIFKSNLRPVFFTNYTMYQYFAVFFRKWKSIENKIAFQWDAYRPLVDPIPACTVQGGVCPGGVSVRGYLPRGCLPRGCLPRGVFLPRGGWCIPACNGADPAPPPVDRQTCVKT